jgi:hypothetical protein
MHKSFGVDDVLLQHFLVNLEVRIGLFYCALVQHICVQKRRYINALLLTDIIFFKLSHFGMRLHVRVEHKRCQSIIDLIGRLILDDS